MPQPYLDALSVESRRVMWAQIHARGDSELILAEESGVVLGFSSYGKSRDPDASDHTGEVYAIYVSPSRWSTGIGWKLARHSLRDLEGQGYSRTTAWVLSENDRAIRFYERLGFNRCPGSDKMVKIGGQELLEVRYEIAAAG